MVYKFSVGERAGYISEPDGFDLPRGVVVAGFLSPLGGEPVYWVEGEGLRWACVESCLIKR